MFIGISVDGRVSLGGSPFKHIGGNIYMDPYGGFVIEISDSGPVEYYNSSLDSEYERGKVKKVGSTYFYYNTLSIDSDYERGKVKKVGNTSIYYNTLSIDSDYERGKVKKIGDYSVYYYTSSIDYSYERGKVKKIGYYTVNYDSYGNVKSIG